MTGSRPSSDAGVGPSEDRDPDTCGSCGGTSLTQLALVLTDGTPVTFISCHTCEQRQWLTERDDGSWQVLPIEVVLERSARKQP